MKNIKYALVVLAAVLSAVSCTKEIENEQSVLGGDANKGNMIINAVAGSLGKPEADTKAHGEFCYDVVWDTDDQISVVDDSNNQGLFNLIEGVGETLGKFQQATGTTLSGAVTGYYPASLLQEDGTLFWPAEQTYSKELTGIPMTASATVAEEGGTNFNFKNLGGVLQLVLTSEDGLLPMKSITVSAENAGMSGTFTIEDGIATGFAAGTSVTLDCTGLNLGASASTVNISLPAGTYSNMTLLFETASGMARTLVSSKLTITRNVVSKVTLALSGFSSEYPEYLSFTASGASMPVGLKKTGSPTTVELEYCFDVTAGSWTSWTADASVDDVQTIATLNKGQTMFLRTKTAQSSMRGWTFDFGSGSGTVAAGGSVMSLLDPAAASTEVGSYAFASLFEDAIALTSAPALPATTLGANCYEKMFYGCTGLTEAPELPAPYLANRCYKSMFEESGLRSTAAMGASTLAGHSCYQMYMSCKDLVSVRPLTATTLAPDCYNSMFSMCTALTEAPALPALKLEDSCYEAMFMDCASLVKPCELPVKSMATECYQDMFRGCTSLTTAPALPATELAANCYCNMFESCTSLVNTPELPALELAQSCYCGMFDECTSLTKAPELPATKLATSCYAYMFRDCTSLEYAPYLPAQKLGALSYMYMFYHCSKLKYVSANFTEWGNESGINTLMWLSGVGASGTFCCPAGLDVSVSDADHVPAGWTVKTDAAPSNIGDLYWSAGIEGIYVGDKDGKKMIFATKNYGADTDTDLGIAMSKSQLNALTLPEGWSIPTSDDWDFLTGKYDFTDAWFKCTSAYIGSVWYYIPYSHNVKDDKMEARLWIKNSDPYDFYWFRTDNFHGKTDLDTSTNYLRVVKML